MWEPSDGMAGRIGGLLARRATAEEILADYPYLEADDISAALSYSES